MHENNQQFKCEICNKLFKSKSSLQRHHENIRKFQCNQCEASFRQRVNLCTHVQRLHDPHRTKTSVFKCSHCSCIFTRLNSLNRHITTRHKEKESETALDIADDPKQLANIVVAQLKHLEHVLSAKKIEANGVPKHVQSFDEVVLIDESKIFKSTVVDKLNPGLNAQLITVQKIKRPNQHLSYVCEYCSKEFIKTYDFIRHRRIHTKERPYFCHICSKSFITKTKHNAHIQRIHLLDEKSGLFTNQNECCVCLKNFCSNRQLDMHMSVHKATHWVQYICGECNRKFKSMSAFSVHKHESSDKKIHKLEPVITVPRYSYLNVKNQIFCDTCGLIHRTQQELHKHKKLHTLFKKFKCEICGCSYMSIWSLRVHLKIHELQNYFYCTMCPHQRFSTKAQLTRHTRYAHIINKDINAKENSIINKRMKGQVVLQKLNTDPCTSKFIEIEKVSKCKKHKHDNIIVHSHTMQAVTTTAENISSKKMCTYCTKQFQKPSDLLRHIRTHTAERPFQCEVCSKNFKLKSTLDEHKQTHLAPMQRKKIVCQVCGKPYASAKSLEIHLRLHTGRKPFKCDYCEKLFRTSGHRLAHMKAAKAKNGICKNEHSNRFLDC